MLRKLVLLSLLIASGAQAAKVTGIDGVSVDVKNPKRIVALNASTVEILFKLGKGNLLVGTDSSATYPAAAARFATLGHPYRVPVEGTISLKPDLVIGTEESFPESTAQQLRGAGLNVLKLENSGEGGIPALKRRITAIAAALNAQASGQKLIREIDAQLATLKAQVQKANTKPRVLFLYAHGPGDASIYGRQTGSETLMELVGAVNAVDFTDGMKPLTAEAMVQANPDAIIMLERGFEAVKGLEGVLKMPGVALTNAGKNKRIYVVDNSIRWVGPRFPEFASKLFKDMQAPAR
ncbi:iron complex transport system substrate-binding protein [Deinobacterium chartae]|uniref:Iron complex transport system substrate-binding protein n=1 Tax=Deinobacterium chartae TaxID=521158 RepID=A0A841HZP0_9DEIO|nr:ABC transporter substrate-binding protein [Deinobacterium chartae]MBB6097478.1 iron complex transport system substrate-binding protein [Deinobacterium chartae]